MADPQQQMTAQDFAQSVRAKYPGSYDHLSDADLTSKVVAKYPQYKSVIPNAGLADPAAPGPVANVAPTEGPLARTLTAGENRIADIHDQNTAQRQQEQHNFMTNGPIPSSIHLQNPINAIVNPEAQQRFSEGDVAGGLGETGANLAVMEAGRRVAGGEPIGTVENATAPIRGIAKAGNAVLRNPTVQKAAPYVGAAAGYGLGEIAGLPWYARVGLGSGGAAAGRAIKGGATLPGERFGLPPEPPSYDKTVMPDQAAPMKRDPSTLGPPAGVGTYQPPERIPPPVRTAPIRTTPEPAAEKPPQVSMADQIATAKGLGFKNINEAINKFGFQGWQKLLGQNEPSPEPPSVHPGSPTAFHSDAPLTPSDLMNPRMSTRIPTWEEVERQGAKERFYAEAPQVKTKNQLVNEVQPSMVAKSEANTSPYDRNLPTKKIRK